jgi:hypothetical protein
MSTASINTNSCLVGECPEAAGDQQPLCAAHWQRVPLALKRRLRRASHEGAEASAAYESALRACVEAAEASCQPAADKNLRRMVRTFLAAYRHPNAINGESWDEDDVTRLIRAMRCYPHRPDPRTQRCTSCGVTVKA